MVIDPVQECWNLHRQFDDAQVRDVDPFFCRVRRVEQHTVFDIGRHLPQIGRMRFLNVDNVELGLVFVGIENTIELGNLPAKRRSSIASEDQHHRSRATKAGQLHFALFIHGGELKVRCY